MYRLPIRRARLWRTTALILLLVALSSGVVNAQSPTPTYYAFDSASTGGWPPTAPYTSSAPTAVVIEGVYGSTVSGCTGFDNRYTPANIESKTVYWLNQGRDVITEITPDSACGSLSYYEGLVSTIASYVEAHASNAGNLWAGIMLDEERTFWSGTYAQQLSAFEALNNATANVMVTTPGLSWYFTENQPNDFYPADTNALYGSGWIAPQVYQQTFLNATNYLCTNYNKCTNMVTINSTLSTSWANYAWVTPQVNGYSWSVSYSAWHSGAGWWNEWRPV